MKLLTRRSRVVMYLVAIVAVAYVLGSLWSDYLRESRGVTVGADLPILDIGDAPGFGINAVLQDDDRDARRHSLALLQRGGYDWVRQAFPWRDIEPAKGVFAWGRWDQLVQDYREHGLRVIAVLDRPPAWSRLDNNWPNRPPDRAEDFGDFVAAFAERYRGQVDHLQIWDEPNIFPNWGNRPVDPAGYASLLAVAYQRAKQANPAAVVLLGGLAPNVEPGGRNMSDLLFLDGLYRVGAGQYFDVAAAKPYGLWYRPDDRLVAPERVNFSRVVQWREIMVGHGDKAKPVWAVEFGWNALPADWTGRPSLWGSVTAEEQAAYTVAALRRARSEWPWLPVLILQGYLPLLPADDPAIGFGVVDRSGRPRPVFEAVRALASTASGAPVGFHRVDSRYLNLAGNWERGASQLTATMPATLRLRFAGTRLDVMVEQGPQAAMAIVTVDGQPANRLPQVDGQAYLDARNKDARTGRVTLADGLPAGEHELQLAVVPPQRLWPHRLDPAGTLSIKGFFVIRERDYGSRLWLTFGLALLAAVLLRQLALAAGEWPGRDGLSRVLAAWRRLSGNRQDLIAFAVLGISTAALYAVPAPFAALPAALVFVSILARPAAAILALIAAAPIVSLPLRIGTAQVAAAEVLALAACLALAGRWLARRIAEGRNHRAIPSLSTARCVGWLASGFNGPITLFVLAGIAATLSAEYQREALRELRTVILEPLIIYALIVRREGSAARVGELSNGASPGRLIDALVIVGAGIAALGLYQYFFTDDVIVAEGVRRLRAFYGSPNNLGLFLGRIIPLAVCVAAGDRRRRWYLLGLAPLLAALGLSFSVGAWVGVAAALLFAAALQGVRVAVPAAGGVAAVLVGALALLPIDRLNSHLSLDQGTTRLRLLLWQSALNMLRDHPVLGVGPDNFLRLYRGRYMLPDAWREPDLSHPHNLLLDFWLHSGIAGFAAGLWSVVRFFAVGLDVYRRLADPARRALALGLLASMVDFVVHGFVDNSLFLVDLALLFWLSCGVLELLRQEAYNSASVP